MSLDLLKMSSDLNLCVLPSHYKRRNTTLFQCSIAGPFISFIASV